MLTACSNKRNIVLAILSSGILITATGCSTWQEKTQGIVSKASTSLEKANSLGAEKYAPSTMQSADKYITLAKQALENGKFPDAQRHAEKASVDAQLAGIQASSGERNDKIKSLQEQISKLMP